MRDDDPARPSEDGTFLWALERAHAAERFVLALGIAKGGRFETLGTAFVVGPALALTARHVITTAWRTFEGREVPGEQDAHVVGLWPRSCG